MTIQLDNLGKKYLKEWIFKNANYEFLSANSYAVIGANGAGKSTFLQILSSIIPATEGRINYKKNNVTIEHSDIYKYLSIVAPYQSLIEEFSLAELFNFHFSFRKPSNSTLLFKDWLDKLKLTNHDNKPLLFFSSGMKQRVKLGLAFYTENNLLLLDEPTNNLDTQGIQWYNEELETVIGNNATTVIICSNQPSEYAQCNHKIDLAYWKK